MASWLTAASYATHANVGNSTAASAAAGAQAVAVTAHSSENLAAAPAGHLTREVRGRKRYEIVGCVARPWFQDPDDDLTVLVVKVDRN